MNVGDIDLGLSVRITVCLLLRLWVTLLFPDDMSFGKPGDMYVNQSTLELERRSSCYKTYFTYQIFPIHLSSKNESITHRRNNRRDNDVHSNHY